LTGLTQGETADGERADSWVGFHTFRHTRATRLFRGHWDEAAAAYVGGWNATQVCKFLGHTDPGFTLRTYVHLLPEDLPAPVFNAPRGATRGQQNPPKRAETMHRSRRQSRLRSSAAETGRDRTGHS